jgi:hypothetical protein
VSRDATVGASRLFRRADACPDVRNGELIRAVADARREWALAQHYFQCVAEPALVDHAVLLLAAAERRYAHLLAEARRAGLRFPWDELLERHI